MTLVHPFVAARAPRIAVGATVPSAASSSASQIPGWVPLLVVGGVVGLVLVSGDRHADADARASAPAPRASTPAPRARHTYDVRGESMDDREVAEIAVRYPSWGKLIVEAQPSKERAHLRAVIDEYATSPDGMREAEDARYYAAHPEPLSRRA
ncbi:MAG: hypothetical protein ACHREM_00660 [Polyangiales bacterium]